MAAASGLLLASCGPSQTGDPRPAPAIETDAVPPPREGAQQRTVKVINRLPTAIAKIHFSTDRDETWRRGGFQGAIASGESKPVAFDGWPSECNYYVRALLQDGSRKVTRYDVCGYDSITFEVTE